MGTKRNFPDRNAPACTPPNYVPEAWAVRYVCGNKDEWRKYPSSTAVKLGIQGMNHFSIGMKQVDGHWISEIWTAEIWHWYPVGPGIPGTWCVERTEVHRMTPEGKWETFSA